ncbi:MAG: hypothetical protein U5K43_07125 [Halofilum sp. (in: g-proteobacteria)]|nr:hypothetical protein [Halofilum sp. (in: g-proteobacteria)]
MPKGVPVLLSALAAGGTLPLAFAPWSWWWLAPLPLAALFLLVMNASPRRAFGVGYAFGLGLFGVGVSWVHISVARFGDGGAPLAVTATAAFVGLLALFPATAVGLARLVSPRRRLIDLTLVLPTCWVLLEWCRTWVLTGFPWLILGYSQTGSALGRAAAPVIGVLGTSLIVASVAGALTLVAVARDTRRRLAVVAVAATAVALVAIVAERD